MNPVDLVRYIVWYATENSIRLTTNRLVKFIYLADLYHARYKNGQTLTGFPWKFIYYGPYCSEAMQCIDQAVHDGLIFKQTFDSSFGEAKEYHIFTCRDEDAEAIERTIPIWVLGSTRNVIQKFGDDTSQLLDYTYFDTEPMANARKGDLLDFSKAERPEPSKKVKLKKMSSDSIRLARKKIKQLSDEMDADRERLKKDKLETAKYEDGAYCDFLSMLDGQELKIGLKGSAKIQVTE
ncbi:MAG: DUF4065 domain-containing protein [Candidatus Electrothrix sp. ATG2]|nr:DUF4065 domain-containing protein [Candidatus Electrothrix sp. ATG2]